MDQTRDLRIHANAPLTRSRVRSAQVSIDTLITMVISQGQVAFMAEKHRACLTPISESEENEMVDTYEDALRLFGEWSAKMVTHKAQT